MFYTMTGKISNFLFHYEKSEVYVQAFVKKCNTGLLHHRESWLEIGDHDRELCLLIILRKLITRQVDVVKFCSFQLHIWRVRLTEKQTMFHWIMLKKGVKQTVQMESENINWFIVMANKLLLEAKGLQNQRIIIQRTIDVVTRHKTPYIKNYQLKDKHATPVTTKWRTWTFITIKYTPSFIDIKEFRKRRSNLHMSISKDYTFILITNYYLCW